MLMRTFVGFYFVSKADDLLSEVLGGSQQNVNRVIKPWPSGRASAGRHDQHEGRTEDECVSPSHNGGYEYSRIVPKCPFINGSIGH